MKKIVFLGLGTLCSSVVLAQANKDQNDLLGAWQNSSGSTYSVVNDWSSQFNNGDFLVAQSSSDDIRRQLSIGNVDVKTESSSKSSISVNLPAGEVQTSVRNSRTELSIFASGLDVVADESGRDIDVSGSNPLIERYRLIPGDGGATLVFDLKTAVTQQSYGQDGVLIIELEAKDSADLAKQDPIDPSVAPSSALPNFKPQISSQPIANQSGNPDRITLSLQDVSVRQLLQIFANQRNLNMVVSDSVQGNISVELEDVPWQQAFDIVLNSKDLESEKKNNVLYVAPKAELAAKRLAELESNKVEEDLAPLKQEVVQLNYASALDISAAFDKFGGEGGDNASDVLTSSRGHIIADERTNSLIIRDLPENIPNIIRTVKILDRPVKQVMIDARIVLARDDFSKQIGAKWGIAGRAADGSNAIGVAGGPIGNAIGASNNSVVGNRIGVDLGANSALGANPARLGFAVLSKNFLLDLELSAMQAEGRGETLSNPRVVTTNNKEATIKQGDEIPYATRSGNGTTTLFKQAVLELKVTPRITPSGRVFLDLTVKKDEIGKETGSGPIINKREVKTQVIVDNGNTVVLGGVFEKFSTHDIEKVPFLGDLPAVGRLFRRNSTRDTKLELLIFVTPTIL